MENVTAIEGKVYRVSVSLVTKFDDGEESEDDIYMQEVEALDVRRVVAAVNDFQFPKSVWQTPLSPILMSEKELKTHMSNDGA